VIARHLGHDRKTIRYAVLGITDRLAVHVKAVGQLVLRPTRVPMNQDLRNVDHIEGSPRHSGLPSADSPAEDCCSARVRTRRRAHVVPQGNYVIAEPPNQGNYVIADRPHPKLANYLTLGQVPHQYRRCSVASATALRQLTSLGRSAARECRIHSSRAWRTDRRRLVAWLGSREVSP
jgi:hypothetical protein